MNLLNDSFLKTLRLEKTSYTPAWIMRQAGRYLPEYRETRKNAGSFMDLCRNTSFATEVTMQPLELYPHLDAAILFSDILTIPDAMGLELDFVEGHGPKFNNPITFKYFCKIGEKHCKLWVKIGGATPCPYPVQPQHKAGKR